MGAPAVASRALRVVSPHAPHRITKLVRHYKNQENRGNVPALAPAALARGAVGEVELLRAPGVLMLRLVLRPKSCHCDPMRVQ